MPNTIASTVFVDYVSGATITTTEVDAKHNAFRGNVLPIDETTSAALNNTYHLGTDTYRFRSSYANPAINMTTVSATYSMTALDHCVLVNNTAGAVTITLPSAASLTGQSFMIKKIADTLTTITLEGSGSETIDSNTNRKLATFNEYIVCKSDGTNFQIVDRYNNTDWRNYTPTLTWSTNVAITAKWKRKGSNFEGMMRVDVSGAPTTAALVFGWAPTGITPLASAMPGGAFVNDSSQIVGVGACTAVSGNRMPSISVLIDTTTGLNLRPVAMYWTATTGHRLQGITQNTPGVFASGDDIHINFSIPITDWEE